jgi:hypothetical protein
MSESSASDDQRESRPAWRAAPLLVAAAAVAVFWFWRFPPADQRGEAIDVPGARPVSLTVDFGSGAPQTFEVPYRSEMTVLQALGRAADNDSKFDYQSRGSGESALVIAIDGLENEGAGEAAKNWIYRVNDAMPHESCALYELDPGDAVLWKFGKYE